MVDYKKESDKCVRVNIFAQCDKKGSYDKKPCDKKKEDETCVEVNVFVKCEDGSWKKEDKKDTCVEVNVYAECDKKKEHKHCGCED